MTSSNFGLQVVTYNFTPTLPVPEPGSLACSAPGCSASAWSASPPAGTSLADNWRAGRPGGRGAHPERNGSNANRRRIEPLSVPRGGEGWVRWGPAAIMSRARTTLARALGRKRKAATSAWAPPPHPDPLRPRGGEGAERRLRELHGEFHPLRVGRSGTKLIPVAVCRCSNGARLRVTAGSADEDPYKVNPRHAAASAPSATKAPPVTRLTARCARGARMNRRRLPAKIE